MPGTLPPASKSLAGAAGGLGRGWSPTPFYGMKIAGLDAALAAGFNVVLAHMHLTQAVFEAELQVIERHGLLAAWKVLDVP